MSGSWTVQDAARVLRRPAAADDKYSRGVLGVRTGSDQYPGAAVLGVEAAWRTVSGWSATSGRPCRPRSSCSGAETVTVDGRVQAWLIGSGTDAASRSDAETRRCDASWRQRCRSSSTRGARPRTERDVTAIVTPHDREHARLRATSAWPRARRRRMPSGAASAIETAAALGATVVLKGAVTIVASPSGWATTVSAGTPWLATAGTGDVLAGAIGAVVAGAAPGADLVDPSRRPAYGCTAARRAWPRATSVPRAVRSPRWMWPRHSRAPSPRPSRLAEPAPVGNRLETGAP